MLASKLRALLIPLFIFSMLSLLTTTVACSPAPAEPAAPTEVSDTIIGPATAERTPERLAFRFRNMKEIVDTRTIPRSRTPQPFGEPAEPFAITYTFDGSEYDLDEFATRTDATGVLILHGEEVLHEGYYQGAERSSRFLSMSVAKSFVSTLVAIALSDGWIENIDDPLTRYLPELAGTGYDGASIEDLLQMSSGIDFVEEYADGESDIARLASAGRIEELRYNEIAVSFPRAKEPGSTFHYASNDTQILGMLLTRVSSKSLSQLLGERLWQPLGAEYDAYWIIDHPSNAGVENAFGGLNVALRDFGKLGLLMARDGVWQGERLLPEGWVTAATIPNAPHVEYGRLYDGYPLGYGYHWWCLPGPRHTFTAEGIHGQFIMVDPELDVVIAKTSSWPEAWVSSKEMEGYALFDAVRAWVRSKG